MLRGWLLDSAADEDENAIVLWLHTGRRVHKIIDRTFQPSLYVHHASLEELRSLQKALETLDGIAETAIEPQRLWLTDPPRPTLRVTFSAYRELRRTASLIDRRGGYRAFGLYNVDIRFSERHFVERGLFPFAQVRFDGRRFELQDDLDDLAYPLPTLTSATLSAEVAAAKRIPRLEDPLRALQLDEAHLEGSEEEMLTGLCKLLRRLNPDVLYTMDGDAFLLPYLHHRARLLGLERFQLGRDPDRLPSAGRRRRTFTSYGRVIYKPQGFPLQGRLHLDHRSSFLFLESGLYGLIDLARLSALPLQDLARLSPGNAINAMEINQALRDGCLVLWKKNRAEDFKSAEELVHADRGGFIYEPRVGIHDRVLEVDFASLYPTIMVRFNISPETLNCPCCPEARRRVPGLPYWTCDAREGLIPRVLRRLVERRSRFKRLAKLPSPAQAVYQERVSILKWILVTAFGYTGYKNARFGRIECHEAINAYAREILLRASSLAESHGYRILHGIVDSLWLQGEGDPDELCAHISQNLGLPLEPEGLYRWIVFLPNKTNGVGALNRYYGLFEDGRYKLRGIELRRHDTAPFLRAFQQEVLAAFAQAPDGAGVLARIPQALEILCRYASALRRGAVQPEQLVLTKHISQTLEEYVQFNDCTAALRQLRSAGFRVEPGQAVRFVITEGESRDPLRRVRVAEFLDEGCGYDAEAYVRLLARSAETLLAAFGFTEEGLLAELNGVNRPSAQGDTFI